MAYTIRYNMITAYYCGIDEHPQAHMRSLGISYSDSESVPIADIWIFSGCENIPDPLPEYLEII